MSKTEIKLFQLLKEF